MTARDPQPSISASAVGEYVYCARAWGLRALTADAPDPAAAARRAQGLPAAWRPGAAGRLASRLRRRDVALRDGTSTHHRHNRRARMSGWLGRAGLLLILAALGLGFLPLLAR